MVAVGKHALDRESRTVTVAGHEVRVKLARIGHEVVNAQPEYVDLVAVSEATGVPLKTVLAQAQAAVLALTEP